MKWSKRSWRNWNLNIQKERESDKAIAELEQAGFKKANVLGLTVGEDV